MNLQSLEFALQFNLIVCIISSLIFLFCAKIDEKKETNFNIKVGLTFAFIFGIGCLNTIYLLTELLTTKN